MAIFSNDTMVFQRVCHLLTTTIAFFLQLNHSNGTESSQIQNLPIVDSGLKWPKYIVESSTYCENFGRRGHCENRVFIHSGGRKTTFREAEGGFRGDFSPSQFTQFVRFCAKKKLSTLAWVAGPNVPRQPKPLSAKWIRPFEQKSYGNTLILKVWHVPSEESFGAVLFWAGS